MEKFHGKKAQEAPNKTQLKHKNLALYQDKENSEGSVTELRAAFSIWGVGRFQQGLLD